jgi:hypothetical protein
LTEKPISHVVFRKQVSDGNYGTEAAEVSLDVSYAYDGPDWDKVVRETLTDARRLVHEELGRSPSANVRRALEPPRVAAATGPSDDPEDLPF